MYMERSILKREAAEIDTPFGKMKVKVCDLSDGKRIYPEYEEVARICRETGLSYYEVSGIFLDTLYTERYNEESNRKQE